MDRNTIKCIAFDVDGTLTKGNVWVRLHTFMGITPQEDQEWFESYESGKVTFEQWNNFIVNKYHESKKTKAEISEFLRSYDLYEDAPEIVQALKKKYEVILVSGGIDEYVKDVAHNLGISTWYANYSLIFDDQDCVIDINRIEEEDKRKVSVLNEFCAQQQISPTQITYVGDSSNDLAAFKFTGNGILLGEGNEKLRACATNRINSLAELLHLL